MSSPLDEEVEIINSIYESCAHYEPSTSIMVLEVPDSRARVKMWFPVQYPDEAPRVSNVSGTIDDQKAEVELNALIKYTFISGEVYLFTFLDEMKAVLLPLEVDESTSTEQESAVDTASSTQKSERVDQWVVTDEIRDRKSTFVGRAISASSEAEAAEVITDILYDKKVARASHNMFAWRIKLDEAGTQYAQDFDEDGEGGAGACMLHILQVTQAQNVVVLVSRYFGGVHIGPDRFKHIKTSTRDALRKGSFINK